MSSIHFTLLNQNKGAQYEGVLHLTCDYISSPVLYWFMACSEVFGEFFMYDMGLQKEV